MGRTIYKNISIQFFYELKEVVGVCIQKKLGDHAEMVIQAVLPEESIGDLLDGITNVTGIELDQEDGGFWRPVFHGVVEEAEVSQEGGRAVLTLKAASYTALLDRKRRRRSFFRQNATYQEVLDAVLRDTAGAALKDNAGIGREAIHPLIQYDETDWQFIKRVASLLGVAVMPDCGGDTPRFYIGLPEVPGEGQLQGEEIAETVCLRNGAGLHSVQIKGTELYGLGDISVSKNGGRHVVTQMEGCLEQEEFIGRYTLRPIEETEVEPLENEGVRGASLTGRVKACRGDKVALALDIDIDIGGGWDGGVEDWYFPYAVKSAGIYGMPREGERVHLYFPTAREWEATAVSSEWESYGDPGHGTVPGGDPERKHFSVPSGASLQMAPQAVALRSGGGMQICVQKYGDIKITGENITMESGGKIQIGGLADGADEDGAAAGRLFLAAGESVLLGRMLSQPFTGDIKVDKKQYVLVGEGVQFSAAGRVKTIIQNNWGREEEGVETSQLEGGGVLEPEEVLNPPTLGETCRRLGDFIINSAISTIMDSSGLEAGDRGDTEIVPAFVFTMGSRTDGEKE